MSYIPFAFAGLPLVDLFKNYFSPLLGIGYCSHKCFIHTGRPCIRTPRMTPSIFSHNP